MIFSFEELHLKYWQGFVLASVLLLSACGDEGSQQAGKQPQAQTQPQQAPPQYSPPAVYPPVYPQQPPVPGYTPGQYNAPPPGSGYAPQAPPVDHKSGSRQPDNPWSGLPRVDTADSSRTQSTWRPSQNYSIPDGYARQPSGMSGKYRPLDNQPEPVEQPATRWPNTAPAYAPPPYPGGYGSYYPGGGPGYGGIVPGYGYGSGWPGGYGGWFPGGFAPPTGW